MNQTAPVAQNHICISHAYFIEGMRASENIEYKKSVKKITFFITLIFMAAVAWLLYTGGALIFLLGEAIFLGALLFWLIVMLPKSRRSSRYKAMTHGTKEEPERTTAFYQNHLTVTANDGKKTVIQYSDIVSWQETKNLYLLNCQNNVRILLDKKGFNTGSFEDVAKLLK